MFKAKKLTSLMAMFLAGAFIFTACDDDDEAEPELEAPEFEYFRVAGDNVNEDDTHEHQVGDSIHFTTRVTAPEGLEELVITEINGGSDVIEEYELDGETQVVEYTYYVGNEDVERLQFDLYDEENQSVRFTYRMDISQDAVRSSDGVNLSSWDSDEYPNFYDIDNLEGYSRADGGGSPSEAEQELIDIIYFYGSGEEGNEATLASPFSEVVESFENSYGMPWEHRNNTGLKDVDVDFDAVETATELGEIWDDGGDIIEHANHLEVGDQLSIFTEQGNFALIEVTSIEDGQAGYITVDIKVEQ